jgi:hypothetical protein
VASSPRLGPHPRRKTELDNDLDTAGKSDLRGQQMDENMAKGGVFIP